MTSGAKVLLLGAGTVGQAAARFAAELDGISQLIVADRDLDQASRAAGERAEAITLDVTDRAALGAAMRSADFVLNCVGPFFRFGPPVLAAAIEAGCAYLDICDDPEPTLAMLDLDARARAAGVTAVVGQGASPGSSNLLAMMVAAATPGCNSLITGWSLDDDPGDADGAANEHWIEQATGEILVWREGQLTSERPLAELEVALPGFPPRSALTIGHPEAVTLPRVIGGLDTCINVMTLPSALAATLKRAARAVAVEGLAPMEASRRELARHQPGSGEPVPEYPGVWALAEGPDGAAGAFIPDYGRMTDMATATAAPLVAGLALLMAGKAARTGVLAPEEAFRPDDYFAALSRIAGVEGDFVRLVRA
ncbi:saccharopine dehydrogenase family protein [Novosphingobium sp. NDB2Meth1]|uniref:saccharopine dehydrogenase family protein n=1 Tax=Novosphingobium sp. NDB2Meth1 TaxID=1892847 RepID=UPI000930F22A|nr:saccharopine dehydrogenase NADP-binding domain-containing protein [Novosphingobium sp. NDB2Meth1]